MDGRGPFATNDATITALAADGAFAIAYMPADRALTLDLSKLPGETVTARWFNPRTGEATRIGDFSDKKRQTFAPPADGDWVLVADNAEKKFPPPGRETGATD